MKIMFSDGTLMRGGAERVISILASKLAELGHDVEILLYYDRKICFSINDKVKITSDESFIGKSNIIKHILWRHKYIKIRNPDIVISFLAPFNMVTIMSMIGLNVPIIVADRNDPKRVPENFVIRKVRDFLYEFANGVVVQNNTNKKYFSNKIQNRSKVIFNPVDLKKHEAIALKIKNKEKVIVNVARVIKQKNPLLLLHAFRKITKEFPDYKLVYYGDGDMIDTVKREAECLGIADKVELPGAISDVFDKIQSAELFVLNSDYEGMPNALLEAMCIGLPVISTKVSGAVDVINNEVNGLLVECNDENDLARAIKRMLGNSDLRLRCSENASKLAEQLNVNKITNTWIKYIEGFKQ